MSDDPVKTKESLLASAQQALADSGIEVGDLFLHYKSLDVDHPNEPGIYVVMQLSVQENTMQPCITYHSLRRNSTWTRTLADFTDSLQVASRKSETGTVTVQRFLYVGNMGQIPLSLFTKGD